MLVSATNLLPLGMESAFTFPEQPPVMYYLHLSLFCRGGLSWQALNNTPVHKVSAVRMRALRSRLLALFDVYFNIEWWGKHRTEGKQLGHQDHDARNVYTRPSAIY